MAKSRTITRTVVARAPTPTIRIQAPAAIRAVGRGARRAGRRAARGAYSEKHRLVPIVAAYALGVAKKNGTKLPTIMGLGPAASVGLIAWAIGKYTRNALASHSATGLLSVAAYSYGESGQVAGDSRAVVYDDD